MASKSKARSFGIPNWPAVSINDDKRKLKEKSETFADFLTGTQPYSEGVGLRFRFDPSKNGTEPVLDVEPCLANSLAALSQSIVGHSEFVELEAGFCLRAYDAVIWAESGVRILPEGWLRLLFRIEGAQAFVCRKLGQLDLEGGTCVVTSQKAGVDSAEWDYCGRGRGVSLYCKAQFLRKFLGEINSQIPDPIHSYMTDQYEDIIFETVKMTPAMVHAAIDILETPLTGQIRKRYVEAKGHELLTLLAAEMLDGNDNSRLPVRMTAGDIQRVHQARRILEREYVSPPPVEELALDLGINRNKLRYGFKSLFGETVSQFVQTRRFEVAWRMIREQNINVSQAAEKVGYEYPGNFSAAFKKHFGFTPKQLNRRDP